MGLISTFSPAPQRDGSDVTSSAHSSYIVSNISSGDSYLDATSKIKEITLYYEHETHLNGAAGNRQKKRIRHFSEDSFETLVSWSAFARDGTWAQAKMKLVGHEDATSFYYKGTDFTSEDLILP